MNNMNKEIFASRLKKALVKKYADTQTAEQYFLDIEQGKNPQLPDGINATFACAIYSEEDTVQKWTSPKSDRFPRLDMIFGICELLGISMDYLMGISDEIETLDKSYISQKYLISVEELTEREEARAILDERNSMREEWELYMHKLDEPIDKAIHDGNLERVFAVNCILSQSLDDSIPEPIQLDFALHYLKLACTALENNNDNELANILNDVTEKKRQLCPVA